MGARHRVGIGLLYRPARLLRLAEFIPWNRFRGPIHVQKYQLRDVLRPKALTSCCNFLSEKTTAATDCESKRETNTN
jgi:hypothetical protein